MLEYLGAAAGIAIMAWALIAKYSQGYRARNAWTQGMAAFEAGDITAATRHFQRCVKLVPVWTLPHRMLGRVLARQNLFTRAEEQFRFAAQLEPRNGEGYLDLGLFLATCPPERPDEALDMFEKALEFAPQLREILAGAPQLGPIRDHQRFKALLAKGA